MKLYKQDFAAICRGASSPSASASPRTLAQTASHAPRRDTDAELGRWYPDLRHDVHSLRTSLSQPAPYGDDSAQKGRGERGGDGAPMTRGYGR